MSPKPIVMRTGNKGLTVKINLWPIESQTNAAQARRFIKGQVTHADTKAVKKFNDAGELITILGDWNVEKFKALR